MDEPRDLGRAGADVRRGDGPLPVARASVSGPKPLSQSLLRGSARSSHGRRGPPGPQRAAASAAQSLQKAGYDFDTTPGSSTEVAPSLYRLPDGGRLAIDVTDEAVRIAGHSVPPHGAVVLP